MKYPKFNRKPLDELNKIRFNRAYRVIYDQIEFDNEENDLGLSKEDIEILAWNSATRLIVII